MNTAFLIIDVQNDYFANGKMELEGSLEASQNAKKLLDFFRKKSVPVFHIQHISIKQGATFFLPDTEGAEIHPNVLPLSDEVVILKNFPNSFRNTQLMEHLKKNQIQRLIICGMMTHMCIDATVRAAVDFGFECILIDDACATRNLAFNDTVVPATHVHHAILAALNGTYAKIVSTEEFLLEQD